MSITQQCKVRLFGRPSIEWNNHEQLVPQKLFALLALLATAPNKRMGRKEAINNLWGTSDRQKANASFRQFLVRVKKADQKLPECILKEAGGSLYYNSEFLDIDLENVIELDVPKAVRSGDYETLKSFISVTSEPLLELDTLHNEAFEDWRTNLATQLAGRRTTALVALIDSDHTIGLPAYREQLALQLLETDPSQELAYRVLMEHYCESWDRARARDVYWQCAETLLADYGVEPELSTRQLAASLGLTTMGPDRKPPPQPANIQVPSRQGPVPNEDTSLSRIGVPRIILLPPRLVGTTSSTAGILEALLDDITVGLTRYRSISVLAGHSGRIAAQSAIEDAPAIGERYGVQYLVKSTVRPSNEGEIATFLLLDCRAGVSLAALEAPIDTQNLSELFSGVGLEIVRQFVNAIERSEVEFPSAAQNRTAYRYFLEGRRALWCSDLPDLRRARSYFQKSIRESDRFAPAHAGMSRSLSMERLVRGMQCTDLLLESLEFAESSIRLDPLDGRGLRERGFCNLYLRRHEESLQSFAAAASVNPNDADLLADYADALTHASMPSEALSNILRAKALNPDGPDYYDWIHASILYQMANYDGAIQTLQPLASNPAVSRLLAASTAMAGDMKSARRHAKILRTNYPDFDLRRLFTVIPDKNIKDTKHLLEGLWRAGLK
ncbi:MAG: hypothetical protein HKN11_07830 [Rhizobiales bacterium]|nr:hypothetical protein [Hyphomicrobiales bacterium]